MQLNANVPGDLVFIIQALVLFSIAAEFLPTIQRSLPNWLRFSRRPALVPAIVGSTTAQPLATGSGEDNAENKTTNEGVAHREEAQS
jgi:simple sugar transport system permease protein